MSANENGAGKREVFVVGKLSLTKLGGGKVFISSSDGEGMEASEAEVEGWLWEILEREF